MSSQLHFAGAMNADADETLLSPVSPLSTSSSSHEARNNYPPVTLDNPDLQENVSTAQVLPSPSVQTNIAHEFAQAGLSIRESLPEAGPVEDETVRAQLPQNLPDPVETNVLDLGQNAGEGQTFANPMRCGRN
jgi:hypothetical protein